MTHYYFDPKTNTLHGPLDRMPPDKTLESIVDDIEAFSIYEPLWKEFDSYLSSAPSHPHTFTGKSRVVPEGEIEWKYCNCKVGNDCPYRKGKWFSPCRVATPKITGEGKAIPAHIVDDMKLDSYYDGFKDGAKLTEEVKRDKHQNCNCPNEQHNEGCLFHPNNDGAPGYTSTSGEEEGDIYDAVLQYRDSHPEPEQGEECLLFDYMQRINLLSLEEDNPDEDSIRQINELARKAIVLYHTVIHDRIIAFITSIRASFKGSEKVYTLGSCYQFFKILQTVFPDAKAYYNSDHVITKIGDMYYDITGEVKPENHLEMDEHYPHSNVRENLYEIQEKSP